MRLAILRRVADANALTDWLVDAAPEARAIYHEGHLAGDLSPFSRTLSSEQRSELAMLASAAWRLCERGLVHLVQQRIAEGICAYLVIARPRAALHLHRTTRTPPTPGVSASQGNAPKPRERLPLLAVTDVLRAGEAVCTARPAAEAGDDT